MEYKERYERWSLAVEICSSSCMAFVATVTDLMLVSGY